MGTDLNDINLHRIFKEGYLESLVMMYENDYINIYQVEESLDYASYKFSDLIPRLDDADHIAESVEFVQDNYIGEDM